MTTKPRDVENVGILQAFSDEKYQLAAWFSGKSFISPTEMANWPEDVRMREWFIENADRFECDVSPFVEEFLAEVDSIPVYVSPFEAFPSIQWVRIRLMAMVLLRMLGEEGGPGTVDTSGFFRDELKDGD